MKLFYNIVLHAQSKVIQELDFITDPTVIYWAFLCLCIIISNALNPYPLNQQNKQIHRGI